MSFYSVTHRVPAPAKLMPDRTLPYFDKYPLSWKLPIGRGQYNFSVNALGEKRNKEQIGDFDTRMAPREVIEYKAEADPYLKYHFKKPDVRQHMYNQNLVTKDGKVPCTLKEFNTFRRYFHERNTRRVQRGKEIEKEMTFGKEQEQSLFKNEYFTYYRQKEMERMMEQLRSIRNEYKLALFHLEDAKNEYEFLTKRNALSDDKQKELEQEINDREKEVGRRRLEFENMLSWLEGLEDKYQSQIQEKQDEQDEQQAMTEKKFILRDYLQTLSQEEENFKKAVQLFEQARRTDEHMRLTEEEHLIMNHFIYNQLVALRLEKKRKEHKILLQLMRNLDVKGAGSNVSVATMSLSDLDNISLDTIDDLEFHRFMAQVVSINIHPPAENLAQSWLGLIQREKILNDNKSASYHDVDVTTNKTKLYNDFLIQASPFVVRECAKVMAKRIAKRRLTYNFEQPFTNILYGKRRYKAPGVKRIDSGLLQKTRSTQASIATLSSTVATGGKANLQIRDTAKGNFWSQKNHTCQSYMDLLQLRARQIREGAGKPKEFSMEHWNLDDQEEKMKKLRKIMKKKFTENQGGSDASIASVALTFKQPLDFTLVTGYIPKWVKPPTLESESTESMRIKELESQNSLKSKKTTKKSDGSLKQTSGEDFLNWPNWPTGTDGKRTSSDGDGGKKHPHKNVEHKKKSSKNIQGHQGKPEEGHNPFDYPPIWRTSNTNNHKQASKNMREALDIALEIKKKKNLDEDQKYTTDAAEDEAFNKDPKYQEFLRQLNHHVQIAYKNNQEITVSEISLLKRLGREGLTFSQLFVDEDKVGE